LLSAVPLPGAARHRHGRGMAGRRRARDGDLADALARLYGRCDAGLVGDWVLVVECDLRTVLQLYRLAGPADDRHRACPVDYLYPAIRQRNRDLGREPTPAEGPKPRSTGAIILDLQARDARKHAHYLPDDEERVRHLLCELRAVRDPSAARPASQSSPGRTADRACQHMFLSLFAVLGLAGGTHRP